MSLDRVRDLCQEAARAPDPAVGLGLAEQVLAACRLSPGSGHYAFPLCLAAVGELRRRTGDQAGAASAFAELVPAARRVMDLDFEHAVAALGHAARFYGEVGRIEEAERLREEIRYWTGVHLGTDHPLYLTLSR